MARMSYEVLNEAISYDPLTGSFTWKISSGSRSAGALGGNKDHKGYSRLRIFGMYVAAHRAAWALHYGEFPNGILDHINTIKDDNRIANLRIATASQNGSNRAARNAIGIKGITFLKKSGKWQASIGINGKYKYLGVFSDPVEAGKVYAAHAKELYGEFAHQEPT